MHRQKTNNEIFEAITAAEGRLSRQIDHILQRQRELETLVVELQKRGKRMSKQLDELKARVERNTEVDQSAITLLQGLSQQIRDLKDDPAALEQLASQLDASNQALAQAIVDNTPADTGGGTGGGPVDTGGGTPTPESTTSRRR